MSIDDLEASRGGEGESGKRRKINTNGNIKNHRPRTSRIFTPFRVQFFSYCFRECRTDTKVSNLGFRTHFLHFSPIHLNPIGENNLPANNFGRPMSSYL